MSRNRGTYVAKGNRTSEFYRYRDWRLDTAKLAPIPAGPSGRLPHTGCRGTGDGEQFVYMAKGSRTREFWRYDIVADTWQQLPDVPGSRVRAGSDAVYVERGNAGYVYLLKGTGREFCRYDVTEARWESLPSAPVIYHKNWPDGSWLVYDNDSTIYAHRAKYHEFYSFDVTRDSWNPKTLKPMPIPGWNGNKKSRAGGCGAWHETKLYALKGGNTQEMWVYSPARDSWFEIESMPSVGSTDKKRKVKNGADMVSYEGGNIPAVLIMLKGNKTNEVWMYEFVFPGAGRDGSEAVATLPSPTAFSPASCRVTPDPVCGRRFQVTMTPPNTSRVRLSIYDALGRCRVSKSVNGGKAAELDVEQLGLSPGVYIARMDAPGYSATAKFTTTR